MLAWDGIGKSWERRYQRMLRTVLRLMCWWKTHKPRMISAGRERTHVIFQSHQLKTSFVAMQATLMMGSGAVCGELELLVRSRSLLGWKGIIESCATWRERREATTSATDVRDEWRMSTIFYGIVLQQRRHGKG